MMTDYFPILIAWVVGLGTGLFYFGGLWLTIQQLPKSRKPIALLLTSLIIRTGVTVGIFYLVMSEHWERAIACLVGFIMVRFFMTSRLRPDQLYGAVNNQEAASP